MRAVPITWILAITLLGVATGLHLAGQCTEAKCKLPNCKCSTSDSGSKIPLAKIPQIVMPSFDDAVTIITYDLFSKSIFNRKNPDGCPIGATHFLSHEYTDYSKVNDLFSRGHEIALHSVTHDATIEGYWAEINLTTVKTEFGEIRTMANHFAGIPLNEMRGMRLPFLQTSGNVSFQGLQELGLSYDSSLPTEGYKPPIWPYTLEYRSLQNCQIEPCPTASFPNIWEMPMAMWHDERNISCSMVDACVYIPKDAENITKWLTEQFNRHYKGNRAPFPIFMHAGWFLRNPENFKAYVKFIDHLQTLPDVYILSVNKTIEWVKNPKPLDVPDKKPFGECVVNKPLINCSKPLSCATKTSSGEERYITSCVNKCPSNYPWLGNPLGN